MSIICLESQAWGWGGSFCFAGVGIPALYKINKVNKKERNQAFVLVFPFILKREWLIGPSGVRRLFFIISLLQCLSMPALRSPTVTLKRKDLLISYIIVTHNSHSTSLVLYPMSNLQLGWHLRPGK